MKIEDFDLFFELNFLLQIFKNNFVYYIYLIEDIKFNRDWAQSPLINFNI